MRERKTIFWLTFAAFSFRILHYFLFASWITANSDVMRNISLARRFASGDYYGVLDPYWSPVYPVLVGIVSLFIDDITLPAAIVSIVAGSLAAPLTYYLVRQSYGKREAIIAAVIAVFYPYLINSVFDIGTENVYFVWIIGALIFGWKGLKNNSVSNYLVTGILLGLAYLTRPEAIGYPLFFVGLVFSKNFWQKSLFTRNWIIQVAALLLGFAILATPYIYYLRVETGTWTISTKTAKNFAEGTFEDSDPPDVTEISNSTKTAGMLIKTFAFSLREAHKILTSLFPFFLMIFIVLGLFVERWDKERLKRETYLILFCLLTVLGYVVTVMLERYLFILFPIFFGWMACGIVQFERWFRESAENWMPNKVLKRLDFRTITIFCLIFIYSCVFTTNFYVRSKDSSWKGTAFEERDAGLWLHANGKPLPNIFSGNYRPVFYAQGNRFNTTTKDLDKLLSEIKLNKIDYVIWNDRAVKHQPHLKDFDKILQNDSDFELIYDKKDPPNYKISIFRLKSEHLDK